MNGWVEPKPALRRAEALPVLVKVFSDGVTDVHCLRLEKGGEFRDCCLAAKKSERGPCPYVENVGRIED